ncbi:MAG: helix-turn-helix domain-containing protein [Magnetococcales bacterium]|nr:helix-turn-helix domain-containing protein [Magnetococcales bacterium]
MLEIAGNKYYTLREVSELTGVSYNSVRRWVREGRLIAKKIANSRMSYVSEEYLKKMLNPE